MNGSSPAAFGEGAGDAVAASSKDDANTPRAAALLSTRHSLLSTFFRRAAPAAAVLCAASCGSIGDPLPPMANIPERVGDLAARQVVDEIVVTWSWPLLTTEGAAARRLSRFTLRAVEVPADAAGLPEVAIDQHGRDIAVVDGGRLAGKAPGDRFELRLPLEDWRLDRTVILAMIASNRDGRAAGYSNQVKLQPIEPPAAATLAQPTVRQDGIALTWTSPGGAGAYVIERRVGSEPDFSPVARAEETRFVDRAIQWGRRHEYRVRPLAETVAGEAEGRLSATIAVTPTDAFPPAAPPRPSERSPPRSRWNFPGVSTGSPVWPATECSATEKPSPQSSSAPLSATSRRRRAGNTSTRSSPWTARETKASHRRP